MVNKTELLAIEWLEKKGYKENEIIKNSNSSPDFICQDGKRYEIKFLYGNRIIFYDTQIKNLKSNDTILVFDRTKFVTEFLWGDRKKAPIKFQIIEVKGTTIQIEKTTLERLKKKRKYRRETYDEILNRLMVKG